MRKVIYCLGYKGIKSESQCGKIKFRELDIAVVGNEFESKNRVVECVWSSLVKKNWTRVKPKLGKNFSFEVLSIQHE